MENISNEDDDWISEWIVSRDADQFGSAADVYCNDCGFQPAEGTPLDKLFTNTTSRIQIHSSCTRNECDNRNLKKKLIN